MAAEVALSHKARAGNAILITLDGIRTQEIFAGLGRAVLESTFGSGVDIEGVPAFQRYWAPTPEAWRERLMPFFWGTLMARHGSIAGNRALESSVRLTNRHVTCRGRGRRHGTGSGTMPTPSGSRWRTPAPCTFV